MISGDARMSYIYALTTLRGPFPKEREAYLKLHHMPLNML